MNLGSQVDLRRVANRVIRQDPKQKLFTAGNAAFAYSILQQAAARARAQWVTAHTWTLTVAADDDLYWEAQQWLVENGQSMNRRALTARTYFRPNPFGPNKSELRFLADDEETQKMQISGYEISVYLSDNALAVSTPVNTEVKSSSWKPPKLVFSARTRAGRDAVVALLQKLREDASKETRKPGLMVLDRWSDWDRRSDLPGRPMESVIVKGTVLQDLYDDLKNFIAREPDYVRRAIPFHRAYLLVGPPGTGKTSAAKAIANALSLDLWYAQLSGIDKDAKLSDVLGSVRKQGVLLLEDIDSLPAAAPRDSEDKKEGDISTSGLLNALDGVSTPHGLITIMTTNHPDQLDPALLRPGRVDRVFAFEHPDTETLHRHFEFFYGEPPRIVLDPQGRSSAAISEIFKRHMDDPEGAQVAFLGPPDPEEEYRGHLGAAGFSGGKRRGISFLDGGILEGH